MYSDRYFQPIITLGVKGIDKLAPKEGSPSFDNQVFSSTNNEVLKKIVNEFSNSGIQFLFGYGSGVFEQSGYSASEKSSIQIDLIHVVEDGVKFHNVNMATHSSHYSAIKYLPVGIVNHLQNLGAGIYFNPYVPMQSYLVKYGVMSMDKAVEDISEWNSLYLAGRLQKPVNYLIDNRTIRLLNQYNLKSALSLAVLLMKEPYFDERQLYETITRISYLGDIRYILGGENPNKVKNIVSKQFDKFQVLYSLLVDYFVDRRYLVITGEAASTSASASVSSVRQFYKNLSNDDRVYLISKLPLNFRKKLYAFYIDKSIREIARDPSLQDNLVKVIGSIVRWPSVTQLLKGVATAGLLKSARYALEKKLKAMRV